MPLAATLGHYRRFRVKTLGTNEGFDSEWSAASASVRTASSTAASVQTPMLIIFEYPHVIYGVEYGPYPIGLVQKYNTLIWHRRYQGVGEFSLSMPFDAQANESLLCGNLIGIAGRGELMMILSKTISTDDDGVETLEIRGKSMALLLGMRVVTYSVQLEAGPVDQIKSRLRSQPLFCEHYDGGWVDDFNADLYADSYGDRRFPDFHWQEPAFSYAEDDAILCQPEKLVPLLDDVISLCKIKGCGLRVTSAYMGAESFTQTMYFELYMGVDRSVSQDVNPHVVFDEILGNVIRQTYTHSIENKKTAGYAVNTPIDTLSATDLRLLDIMSDNAYAAGDQDYINDGTPTANVNGGSGMNRNELGLSIVEIDEPTEGTTAEKIQVLYDSCKQIGRNEIEKAAEEHAFDIVINPAVGPQYRVDYDLGDIATARNGRYGLSMDGLISETQEIYEANQRMQLMLTLGAPRITLLGRVKQISRRRG